MKNRNIIAALLLYIAVLLGIAGCGSSVSGSPDVEKETAAVETTKEPEATEIPAAPEPTAEPVMPATIDNLLAQIPPYSGTPYVALNNNVPLMNGEGQETSYERYSPLDSLGRCGVAEASVGQDLMPTEKRGKIGQVKPTGWHTVKYENVDGKYLYNRCHLIGFQLTAENANERNLITGTRYMNVDGMLPFENMVADYVKETGNHVQYRVTPIFDGNNLVASGVQMEARSVEDGGAGISYNVFVYNVQPGIIIDYATGDSQGEAATVQETPTPNEKPSDAKENTYVLNTNTKKFHNTSCSSADNIKSANRQEFTGKRDELVEKGYEPCKRCKP